MRLAQIENGVVVNVALVTPGKIPPHMAGWPVLTEEVGPGWLHDGTAFAPPVEDMAETRGQAKVAARAQLAAMMAAARTALITDLPGQDMIYMAKEAEARSWIAAAAPALAEHPMIAAEIGITAPDADSLAQLWLNLGALWRGAAAQLEALRMSTNAAIEAAATVDDVAATMAALAAATGN